MQKMHFSIDIYAPRDRVWSTLWEDKTLREWASIIDPETYMVGEMKEGNEVQFISSASGYGVTSYVDKLVPSEFVLLKHRTDTQEDGKREREEQWTGGEESYSLTEKNGTTTLTVIFDVPPELEETLKVSFPKALKRIKLLTEGRK